MSVIKKMQRTLALTDKIVRCKNGHSVCMSVWCRVATPGFKTKLRTQKLPNILISETRNDKTLLYCQSRRNTKISIVLLPIISFLLSAMHGLQRQNVRFVCDLRAAMQRVSVVCFNCAAAHMHVCACEVQRIFSDRQNMHMHLLGVCLSVCCFTGCFTRHLLSA